MRGQGSLVISYSRLQGKEFFKGFDINIHQWSFELHQIFVLLMGNAYGSTLLPNILEILEVGHWGFSLFVFTGLMGLSFFFSPLYGLDLKKKNLHTSLSLLPPSLFLSPSPPLPSPPLSSPLPLCLFLSLGSTVYPLQAWNSQCRLGWPILTSVTHLSAPASSS